MSNIKMSADDVIEELRHQRDELNVKLHLAKLEARDEWEKIESRFAKFEVKTKELGGVTAEASSDIGEAAKLLGEEIRDGIKKIVNHL